MTETATILLNVDLANRLHVALWGEAPSEADRDLFAEGLDVLCVLWCVDRREAGLDEAHAAATARGRETWAVVSELVGIMDNHTCGLYEPTVVYAEGAPVSEWVQEREARRRRIYERARVAREQQDAAAR